ncbi:MAG: DUF1015 domain-containing protein [Dehalococcoidia bacterium]|nr:DUF1015 domain-containing protein [Dehalococcoidia bacterium]
MADVQPFRGLRYNLEQIGDLSAVLSPPYDVISAEEQLLYYGKSPYNVIRLEFGAERADDSPQENKYTRAALTMESWLREGILIREGSPAFYLVEHRFPYQDAVKSRFSLIARVGLEDLSSGQIRPHEMTMRGPRADRMCLLRSCRANFSPVMGLFRHQGEGILPLLPDRINRPALSVVDKNGVDYRLWVVTDGKAIARVSDFFANKLLYIADGHHRYEIALAYQWEQRSTHPDISGKEGFNFVMMTLTASNAPNLIMMPTHRLVRRLEAKGLAQLREGLAAYCGEEVLSPLPTPSETLKVWLEALKERGRSGTTFGLYGIDGQCLRLLTLRQEMIPIDQPSALKGSDVYILHRLILRQMLGIDSQEMEGDCLEYTRDALGALSWVDSGGYQLAFLLNPTPISRILAVADEGARMPQKSTYFYPKTPAGLVINPLWDD